MKKKSYYILAVCAALLLSGCQKDQTSSDGISSAPTPTQSAQTLSQEERFEQIIMTVGDVPVTYGEAVLYMQSTKEEVETLYGREVWNYVLDDEGTTYAQMLKEELLKQLTYTKLVCAQAREFGITLSEDERMDVDEYTDNYLAGFTAEELTYYGITRDIVERIYQDNLLATKIYESLTLNVDTDVTDEEARHPVIWYVFIAKYGLTEDGTHTVLTEEELQRVKERAEQLAIEAQETEDFYTFAKNNTDDTDEVEIIPGRGEMLDSLEQVAFSLQEGEVSALTEIDSGYFILYCRTYQDEDATEQAKVDTILARQEAAFSERYAVWEAETRVWINETLWNAIDLTGVKCE